MANIIGILFIALSIIAQISASEISNTEDGGKSIENNPPSEIESVELTAASKLFSKLLLTVLNAATSTTNEYGLPRTETFNHNNMLSQKDLHEDVTFLEDNTLSERVKRSTEYDIAPVDPRVLYGYRRCVCGCSIIGCFRQTILKICKAIIALINELLPIPLYLPEPNESYNYYVANRGLKY